jgi:hypothetical protein
MNATSAVRLDRLIGRQVLTANNQPVGRLEEFHVEVRGDACQITDYVIGASGLFERLHIGIKLLIGRRSGGYLAHWDQLDVSDPDHPRLTCRLDELRQL